MEQMHENNGTSPASVFRASSPLVRRTLGVVVVIDRKCPRTAPNGPVTPPFAPCLGSRPSSSNRFGERSPAELARTGAVPRQASHDL